MPHISIFLEMDQMHSLNVYETPTHFYIIGSDPTGNRFRTLKIDRIAEKEFIVGEPDHDYSKADIGELLATVSSSSIVTPTEKWGRRRNCAGGNGLLRTMEKAFGLIGAIRFLEGYYLLLVSRAKQICQIGYHAIYKVEDVSMIYVPASGAPSQPDELKYAKLFQSVDLTTNFYFSYTYQLSRTLQENCLARRGADWNRNSYRSTIGGEKKFIWNDFLLEPFRKNQVSQKWYLELVHGYICHQLVELPCAKLDLILLARRSAEFAGTRFLKRGANTKGAVANDVETEQIIWDTNGPHSFETGKFTAFVQRRGSVPLFWSQDSTNRGAPMVVGKPPILIDRVEPHALTTAMHFRELRRKYAHPIIVLNLVKRDEHKHNENLLHYIFLKTVRYLNQFRRPGHCIDYISFDVSRCNKTGRVLQHLDELGQRTVLSTGWFQSFPQLKSRSPRDLFVHSKRHGLPLPAGASETIDRFEQTEQPLNGQMLLQHGIVRANCVDCLDRTNVAQFGLGKAALGWQLYSMGLLDSPWALGLQTELCRLFEEMFDEHGDTLAWQYAGSQLVHSIKTYKRTAVLQERSRDVLQTISRYYSNTFSDFEKQDGINLFLGIFRVRDGQPPIWSIGSDHYLHFPISAPKKNEFLRWSVSVSSDNEEEDWLKDEEFHDWVMVKAREGQDTRLDNNWVEIAELSESQKIENDNANSDSEMFDLAYRTFELTSLEQLHRQMQQMQIRRPVALDALVQGHQGSTFMWMFKSEHSASSPPPPPYSRKGSTASSIGGTPQGPLSSLAAGTASIVRDESGGGPKKTPVEKGPKKKQRMPPLLMNYEEAEGDEADEEKVEDETASTRGLFLTGLDEGEKKVVAASAESSMANSNDTAAMIAVAVGEDGEKPNELESPHLLVIEDRNAPGEADKDPFRKFQALLNAEKSSGKQLKNKKAQLTLGTGLKSPREVYFGSAANPNRPAAILAISEQDMALYGRYASAAVGVFERHNLRRQRRPTAWKLPNPFRNIRQKPTADASASSPIPAGSSSGRSTPMTARKQKQQQEQAEQRRRSSAEQLTRPIIPVNSPVAKHQQQPQSSPFRKDFSRLGPAFEFRPSLFTVDSAFHTELGEVPAESLRLYKQRVDEAWEERRERALVMMMAKLDVEKAMHDDVDEPVENGIMENGTNGEGLLMVN